MTSYSLYVCEECANFLNMARDDDGYVRHSKIRVALKTRSRSCVCYLCHGDESGPNSVLHRIPGDYVKSLVPNFKMRRLVLQKDKK